MRVTHDLIIRPAVPADFAALAELTAAAYLALPHPPGADYLDELRDVAARARDAEVLVAEDAAGRIVGGVTFVPDRDNPLAEFEDADAAAFRMLAVDPALRQRGAGRRLVEACIERARRRGRRRLVLHTRTDMQAAHRLYESLGFRREPALDWEPVPDVSLLGYALDLHRETR